MTSASTDLSFSRPRVEVKSILVRLGQICALIELIWNGLLALSASAVLVASIISIYFYGPQPVLSGCLIALTIICLIKFEDSYKKVRGRD